MLNRIVIIGRLTRDPELHMTPTDGTPVCNFTLAVDRPFRKANGDRECDFLDVVVWRKPAELCAQYLAKGLLAAVEGRLQIRSYESQDGQRRRVAEVVADNVRFLERKKDGAPAQTEQAAPPDDLDNISLEDLPF